MKKSQAEIIFANQCDMMDIPVEAEFRFHPERRWRFDFAIPEYKIAVEIEGGVWTAGRHTRGAGFIKDAEKYNAAAELGWLVFRYPAHLIGSGGAIQQISRIYECYHRNSGK